MTRLPYLIHALSPLHAGTGQSADIIDLPIARMKATNIPFLPGSSIKGVLRAEARNQAKSDDEKAKMLAVFGPETANASDHAGALVVSDARLLALPVRSFRGTFAWVTSPLLLLLAARDLGDGAPAVPQIAPQTALHTSNSLVCHSDGRIYLDELDLVSNRDAPDAVAVWARLLASILWSETPDVFETRFVIVDDETMTYLFETATQIDTRIRIDSNTGVVADGALWTEESLPPETILIGVLDADRPRAPGRPADLNKAEDVLAVALPTGSQRTLQFGGKATVGRGRCLMTRAEVGRD